MLIPGIRAKTSYFQVYQHVCLFLKLFITAVTFPVMTKAYEKKIMF